MERPAFVKHFSNKAYPVDLFLDRTLVKLAKKFSHLLNCFNKFSVFGFRVIRSHNSLIFSNAL